MIFPLLGISALGNLIGVASLAGGHLRTDIQEESNKFVRAVPLSQHLKVIKMAIVFKFHPSQGRLEVSI